MMKNTKNKELNSLIIVIMGPREHTKSHPKVTPSQSE